MFPESHQDLLSDEKRAAAFLATLMLDGTPQATPIWFSYEEGKLRINTRRGRIKEKNLMARPQMALVIQDPDDTYRFIQVRGLAVNPTEEGADEHIDQLSHKYHDRPFRSLHPNEARVIFEIEPQSVSINE
jgi:PPOX class probable F420-dependent enzyme